VNPAAVGMKGVVKNFSLYGRGGYIFLFLFLISHGLGVKQKKTLIAVLIKVQSESKQLTIHGVMLLE
jgi:hypothetical protein